MALSQKFFDWLHFFEQTLMDCIFGIENRFCFPSLKASDYATSDNLHSLWEIGFDVLGFRDIIMMESDILPSVDFYN